MALSKTCMQRVQSEVPRTRSDRWRHAAAMRAAGVKLRQDTFCSEALHEQVPCEARGAKPRAPRSQDEERCRRGTRAGVPQSFIPELPLLVHGDVGAGRQGAPEVQK